MGVVFKHRGSFKHIERFAKGYDRQKLLRILDSYGRKGVKALAAATPIDSGLSADSWGYRTSVSRGSFFIIFTNNHFTNSGTPVVILIQYGHGTRNGGYVEGRDFINPAIKPVFDEIAAAVWREVSLL